MGVVPMHSESVMIDRGYPVDRVTLYVYCDRCGSFRVAPYWSPIRWLALLTAAGIVAAGAMAFLRAGGPVWWALAVVGLCCIPLPRLMGSQREDYKCRKCGRLSQDKYNTLGYAADQSIVDVPDRSIRTLTMGFGGPEDYGRELDELLEPPCLPVPDPSRELLRDIGGDLLKVLSFPLLLVGAMLGSVLLVISMIVVPLWTDVFSKLFAGAPSGPEER